MTANLFKPAWTGLDQGELRCILHERLGRIGQHRGLAANPYKFYLPLADSSCKVVLTFSAKKELIAIEPGPAFDRAEWSEVVSDIEQTAPIKVGRDISFSGFRVSGSWRGVRSDVQILPAPAGAPQAPVEFAEHPFVVEFPIVANDRWPITNDRRLRRHRAITQLLDVLLVGSVTCQPRRSRHFWAVVPNEQGLLGEVRWLQESYFADFGLVVQDALSPPLGQPMEEVEPDSYYLDIGHDGRHLQVPTDLDDAICRWQVLSSSDRSRLSRACYWMNMASRLWETSFSAVFSSLAIAIEALADKNIGAKAGFREFLEAYAPGIALQDRRNRMYALRSEILHGNLLIEMDQGNHFTWGPPEREEEDLLRELWALTRIAVRKSQFPPAGSPTVHRPQGGEKIASRNRTDEAK